MKIGIPKTLLYFKFHTVWEAFFRELELDVVYSSPSNDLHLSTGMIHAHSDNCLPVKLAYGHVKELMEKCDYIFLPKIIRLGKNGYLCPKMLGFSDMIRNNLDIPEDKIIDISFDNNFSRMELHFTKIAFRFTKNMKKIIKSVFAAGKEYSKLYDTELKLPQNIPGQKKIGLVGHPYNIHDKFVNLNIEEELNSRDITVYSDKHVPPEYTKNMFSDFPGGLFWSFGREIYAVSKRMIDEELVDGIIYLIPFSCGLDSVLMGIVEELAREKKLPFLPLYVDEHTGKAAFVTRLEAFVDMLEMKTVK